MRIQQEWRPRELPIPRPNQPAVQRRDEGAISSAAPRGSCQISQRLASKRAASKCRGPFKNRLRRRVDDVTEDSASLTEAGKAPAAFATLFVRASGVPHFAKCRPELRDVPAPATQSIQLRRLPHWP